MQSATIHPADAGTETPGRVCVGVVAGAHGVEGAVRIKSFTAEPEGVAAYGEVSDDEGARSFAVTVLGVKKGVVLARLAGIRDRNAAEALRGLRLYVARTALPDPEEEEYYHADLIGLQAELEDGRPFGRVRALYDFGAGDVVELDPFAGGPPIVVPFTREAVPVVDLAEGRIVVAPPEGLSKARPEGGRGES